MPIVAPRPDRFSGQVVGTGHCVSFVREATGAPHTSLWRRGDLVRGSSLGPGTAIATFDPDGTYGNHTDGRSHAAILIAEQDGGLECWDQWVGHPVARRVIRWGGSTPVNDGDQFFAVELERGPGV